MSEIYTKVAQEKCIACGLCQIKAPAIFDYTEVGIAFNQLDQNQGSQTIPTNLTDEFKAAYLICPTHAILRASKPF
ncbi:ferredoxin [Carnobacterium gallinarum]|uniref:ferredoxin n=1 Tax=Carnobacterium gallinarum TaxID=2749 RepID=UPI000551CA14|nr:ferredoxin [Carnobacterium gallinarum]